jgi:predicted nucleic acid-binding protein
LKGVTLDAGALIALDRGDGRALALVARAREVGATLTVPATVFAQAIRRPRTQVRLARLVRQPTTQLVPLDGPDATAVGILLAATRTRDIADAHVVICARRAGQPIVTRDTDDLRRLDPAAWLVSL